MKSSATLPAMAPPSGQMAAKPTVFIDGVPEPRLAVVAYTAEAPLNTCSIVLDAAEGWDRPDLLRHWQHARAIVAQPMRLADGQVRWQTLGQGMIHHGDQASSAGQARRHLTLQDDWTSRLDRRLTRMWWSEADGALVSQRAGRLQAGALGNRSQEQFRFAGDDVFVLREGGEAWTLGQALATVNAWAELDLSLDLLPRQIKDAPLMQSVDLGQPIGEVLRRMLEPYDLFVEREALREAERIIERRAVRAIASSRRVRLAMPPTDDAFGQVTAIDGDDPVDAAEPWVARAAGWRVESTFDLVPGWHPSLEGMSDATYGRATSDDFARYGNVYRYWVLNEDGRFSGEPYDRGSAFDLAAFFGEGELRAQALPFQDCVTLDDAGEPRPAIVEVSTDTGQTWQQYPGRVVEAEHRAAVYLDDDELPSAFLAAAKQGDAQVRVTASLQSPWPVEVVRWRGNPFAGSNPPRVFELGEAFRFQHVATASVHRAAIDAGELEARESNSWQAMRQWLVERMREQSQRRGGDKGRLRLTFAGPWLALRPDDRLVYAFGPPLTAGAQPMARVQRVHVRFDRAMTELDLQHA